jgi:dihydroneopterin aldolase
MTVARKKGRGPATAQAGDRGDCIFVRDWVLDCNIGVYAEEKGVTQKVRVTVEAFLAPGVRSLRDDMAEVPSYTEIIDGVKAIAAKGHINLLETFGEEIAERCLANAMITSVRVRIEKLERGPVRGIDITRTRPGPS